MKHGYDGELRRHDPVFRQAWAVRAGDHVLDVGCGGGQTTREAARLAAPGTALGIDISAAAVERARSLAAGENVAFECADAEVHRFTAVHFDLVISRFGMMFFRDPAAAFGNIAGAVRPGGRLVMMVWQSAADNEWDAVLRRTLTSAGAPSVTAGESAFSLADPAVVTGLLESAGFGDAAFEDVREPVYYGADADAALEWVRGFASTKAMLAHLDQDRGLRRLRSVLAGRADSTGVWFGSRSWIVTARRR